jgi:hypothetical protein
MKNAIHMKISWDMDGDIEHDLQSDDDEMRKFARAVKKSGLTKQYAEKNLSFLIESLGSGASDFVVTLNFPARQIEISRKRGNLSFEEARKTLVGGSLNINESSGKAYVQLYSYFQLTEISFVGAGGESKEIDLL